MKRPSGQRTSSSQLRDTLANVVALILSLALTLSALEFATRFIYRDIRLTGDGRSYFSARYARENPPQRNHLGFREREFALSAADDTYRIAAIGDSFIEGHGIRDADRLSNLLERHLSSTETELNFEVLNFSISGSDTEEHIRILETSVSGASPDFVLLGWYVNDVRNDRSLRWSSIPLMPWQRAHQYALRHSALYYIADRFWTDLQHRLGLIESEDGFLAHHFADPEGAHARRSAMLLRGFIESCRNKKIPLGIVLFPPLTRNQSGEFSLGFLLDRVLQVCAEHEVKCVDLRSAFGATDVASLRVNQFDHHPNERANHLAAGAVLGAFEAFWTAAARERVARLAARSAPAAALSPSTEKRRF